MTKRSCLSAEEVLEAVMFEDDLDDFEEPMMDGSDDDFSVILMVIPARAH